MISVKQYGRWWTTGSSQMGKHAVRNPCGEARKGRNLHVRLGGSEVTSRRQ